MRSLLPGLLIFLFFYLFAVNTRAASLSLSPASSNESLSTTFNIEIKLDTEGETIKTIKVNLTFPANFLSVEDISTSGSFIDNWTERLYSNTNGTINLSGQAEANGLSGRDQKIASIKFKARAQGAAAVKFAANSQILEADSANDVLSLTNSKGGSYRLGAGNENQPTATPSGTKIPETGDRGPTWLIALAALSLIILGILMGRPTAPSV